MGLTLPAECQMHTPVGVDSFDRNAELATECRVDEGKIGKF